MPAWLAAAAPAALSGVASFLGQRQANQMNIREAQKNRDFQERMRNTAWQSAVADMQAAGLNPALAYSKGPAASPGGSTASVQDAVSPAISSALQMKRVNAEVRTMQANARSAEAKADLDEWRAGRLLRLKLGGEELMGVERMLQAELGMMEGSARQAAAKASSLEPIAAIADAFIPIIRALSQKSAGGLQQMASPKLIDILRFEAGRLANKGKVKQSKYKEYRPPWKR